jgi:hypothetical protein
MIIYPIVILQNILSGRHVMPYISLMLKWQLPIQLLLISFNKLM